MFEVENSPYSYRIPLRVLYGAVPWTALNTPGIWIVRSTVQAIIYITFAVDVWTHEVCDCTLRTYVSLVFIDANYKLQNMNLM